MENNSSKTKYTHKTRDSVDDWCTGDKKILLMGWARHGLTNLQIANNIGISEQTFYRWCDRSASFVSIIKNNSKQVLDYEMENTLVNLARNGNVTALIFYLKNRVPQEWRDKIEQQIDDTAIKKLDGILTALKEDANEDKSNE